MFGTIIISLVLFAIVALVIASMIKDKRSGRHPSCGGNCGSCGHQCKAAYPHVNEFLSENNSSQIKTSTCRK